MSGLSEKKKDFFWLSYSDLMTSLFFVMLVLFILFYSMQSSSINQLEDQKNKLQADSIELARIKEIERTVNSIDTNYFVYDTIYKKHILNIQLQFDRFEYDINKIYDRNKIKSTFRLQSDLINAGNVIRDLIKKFPEEENIKYLVVIEGQASKDNYVFNNELSYKRALSLKYFWQNHNKELFALKNCEIIIGGSGEGGVPRTFPNDANQRFLITIIPKIGDLQKNNSKLNNRITNDTSLLNQKILSIRNSFNEINN